MADDIEQFLEPSVPIKLAGHSMGGAVAVILAMKLKARGYNVAKVMGVGGVGGTVFGRVMVAFEVRASGRQTRHYDQAPLSFIYVVLRTGDFPFLPHVFSFSDARSLDIILGGLQQAGLRLWSRSCLIYFSCVVSS